MTSARVPFNVTAQPLDSTTTVLPGAIAGELIATDTNNDATVDSSSQSISDEGFASTESTTVAILAVAALCSALVLALVAMRARSALSRSTVQSLGGGGGESSV